MTIKHRISPETGQAIVDNSLWWWHRAILRSLLDGPNNGEALAYNTNSLCFDTARWLSQLERAGMVEHAEPTHDYTPDDWWQLTASGADWAHSGEPV